MLHQVLTVFIIVPPTIELVHIAPCFWRWWINIAWVRYITGRPAPEVPGPEEIGTLDTEFDDEKKEIIDDESSFTDELPLLGKTEKIDHSYGTAEHGQSQLSHPYSSTFIRIFSPYDLLLPPPFPPFANRNPLSHRPAILTDTLLDGRS